MIYIKIYLIFANIGLLSFGGGYATLPLIQKYLVEKYHFIDMQTMLDLISISQSTPGPIAINSASFVGNKLGGLIGAIIATFGVITPQIIILSIFLYFSFGKFNKYLKGISAAVAALILIATIKLIKFSLLINIDAIYLILFFAMLYMYYRKYNVILMIIIGGLVGFLKYTV